MPMPDGFSVRRQVRDLSRHAPLECIEVRSRIGTVSERALAELLLRLDPTVRLGWSSVALDEGRPRGCPSAAVTSGSSNSAALRLSLRNGISPR